MFFVQNISCTVQGSTTTFQSFCDALFAFLEGGNNLAGIIAAIIGGFCALKGIGYLESLREKKAGATFSFEAQLYAYLYELRFMLGEDERLLTGLYSEAAKNEWDNTSAAPAENLDQFYTCAKSTLDFIKSASDQMPAYKSWVADYTNLIQFLVDILHYDIRDIKKNFKYHEMCSMEERSIYWKSICSLLDTLLVGIKADQTEIAKKIFSDKDSGESNLNHDQ